MISFTSMGKEVLIDMAGVTSHYADACSPTAAETIAVALNKLQHERKLMQRAQATTEESYTL